MIVVHHTGACRLVSEHTNRYYPRAAASPRKLADRRTAVKEGRGSGHTGDVNLSIRGPKDEKHPEFCFNGLLWDELTPEQQALV